MILNQRRTQQDLNGSTATLAVRGGNQLLGNDALEVQGEIHPQLAVTVCREEVDDPVQRLVGVIGVQGGQTEVAGFREGNGLVHGFRGPDLADQNHVRCLTQGVLQRHIEGLGINAHLALGDDTALMLMDEFDGVLNGNNVTLRVLVAVPDHGGQRGGLTSTGGAHKDHQAPLGHGQFLDHWRQSQIIHIGNLGLDATQDHGHQIPLIESGHPKTADAPGRDGEVALVVRHEFLALLFGHHAEHDIPGHVRGQRALGDRQNLAVHFHAGGHAGGNEQVGPAFLHHQFEELFEFHLSFSSLD